MDNEAHPSATSTIKPESQHRRSTTEVVAPRWPRMGMLPLIALAGAVDGNILC